MIVAAAVVTWSGYTGEELLDFIETGYLYDKTSAEVMDYCPSVFEELQRRVDEGQAQHV